MSNNMDDWSLLRRYVENGSQKDFETIVARYSRLVYSSAVRRAGQKWADDISQAVFIILARKAGSLRQKKSKTLSSWLYRTTQYTASQAIRESRRRQEREESAAERHTMIKEENHEMEIWNQVKPVLDSVIDGLGKRDKEAVLLRFFQDASYAEIGAAIGVSENTATKRVARALEKMRSRFQRRNIVLTIPILTTLLASRTAEASSEALVSSCVTAALLPAQAIASVGSALLVKGAMKMFWWAQLQNAVVVSLVITTVAGSGYLVRTHAMKTPFELIAVQPFKLSYKAESHLPDNTIVYQVNYGDTQRSLFLKHGKTVKGFTVIKHIKKEELRKMTGIGNPRTVDVSELLIDFNGREILLTKDKYALTKMHEAIIVFKNEDKAKSVLEGEILDARDRQYKVVSIDSTKKEVLLINLSNRKEVTLRINDDDR